MPSPENFNEQQLGKWTYREPLVGQIEVTRPTGEVSTHSAGVARYGLQKTDLHHPDDVPRPLYHGTSREVEGDMIEPGHPGNFVKRMSRVYTSADPERAGKYGNHLYEVTPTGWYGHRRDARGDDYASSSPMKIVKKLR